jgi:hypothetical protein
MRLLFHSYLYSVINLWDGFICGLKGRSSYYLLWFRKLVQLLTKILNLALRKHSVKKIIRGVVRDV